MFQPFLSYKPTRKKKEKKGKVNKQDFLGVFHGSGIDKMEGARKQGISTSVHAVYTEVYFEIIKNKR